MRVCLRPLRSHTIDVAGEHRALLDVGDAEEASGDALQADGEAAVRGHAVSPPLCPRAYLPPRMAYPRPAHTRSYEVYFPTPNFVYPARLHKIYGLSLNKVFVSLTVLSFLLFPLL